MDKNIETIKNKENILAIIIHNEYHKDGIEFFTPGDFSQQLAFISYKAGKIIEPHTHNLVKREISLTQEVLIIKKGKIKINFYNSERNYLDSRILVKGDVILLASGGHGFEVLEDIEIIEVKQGPYANDNDKIKFKGIEKYNFKMLKK